MVSLDSNIPTENTFSKLNVLGQQGNKLLPYPGSSEPRPTIATISYLLIVP